MWIDNSTDEMKGKTKELFYGLGRVPFPINTFRDHQINFHDLVLHTKQFFLLRQASFNFIPHFSIPRNFLLNLLNYLTCLNNLRNSLPSTSDFTVEKFGTQSFSIISLELDNAASKSFPWRRKYARVK
jgi:hypothetical protein